MTYEQVQNPDDDERDGVEHPRYVCTHEELEAAGFTVGDLIDMPETDHEFIPAPADHSPVARPPVRLRVRQAADVQRSCASGCVA